MADYEPQVLRRLQLTELEVFKAFADYCDAHQLAYFAIYGTVLGAVRHQGFIPWDDDMDVGMPRADYERFLVLSHEEPIPGCEVLDIDHTDGYLLEFAKVCKLNTTFVERTDTDRPYHSGIFIDIFPFDETSADPRVQKHHYRVGWLLGRLGVLSEQATPKLPDMNPVLRAVARFICRCVHGVMRLCGLNKQKMHRRFLKNACRYNGQHTGWYLDMSTPDTWNTIVTADTIYPFQHLLFEGCAMQTVHNTDAYLKKYYGNYMEIPPVDKQHNHAPAVLDFDK